MSQQIIDPNIRHLLETASYGEAAKLFFESDLGKYILRRATEEVEVAQNELLEADPSDAKAIAELQRKANCARGSVLWLKEAIDAGDNALKMLETED